MYASKNERDDTDNGRLKINEKQKAQGRPTKKWKMEKRMTCMYTVVNLGNNMRRTSGTMAIPITTPK